MTNAATYSITATPEPTPTSATCAWWLDLGPLDRRLGERWLAWADSPAGRSILDRWAGTHRPLAGWASDELVEPRFSPATDAMQATLVDLAQGGSADAGLTLLVQLRPGLVRLARSASAWEWIMDHDVEEDVQATFFEVLFTLDRTRRRRRIAANLLLDTRQRLWRRFPRQGPATTTVESLDLGNRAGSMPPPCPTGIVDLRLHLSDGVRRLPGSETSRRLTATMAYRAWIEEQPTSAIATDLGVAPQTVATRLYRLRRILQAEW